MKKIKERPSSLLRQLRLLWPFFRPYRKQSVLIVLVSAMNAICGVFGIAMVGPALYLLQDHVTQPSGWLQWVVELAATFSPRTPLHGLLVIVVLSIALKGVSAYLVATVTGLVEKGLLRDLRMAVLDQYLSVGHEFIDARNKGEMREDYFRQTKYTAVIFTALAIGIFRFIDLAALFVLMAVVSWPLLLVAVGGLAIASVALRWLLRRMRILGDSSGRVNDLLSQRVLQVIDGFRTVKDFGREPSERAKVLELTEISNRFGHSTRKLKALLPAGIELMAAVLLTTMIVVTDQLYAEPLPILVTFTLIVARMIPAANQLLAEFALVQDHAYGAVKMAEILDRSDKPYLPDGSRTSIPDGDISLERITFAYGGGRPILDDVSFVIPAGRMTAVVGPSGVGKSTVIELLARFYDPQSGRIHAGGVDIKEFRIAEWRARLGVVRQDTWVFNATVAENIAYGKPGATPHDIEAAARLAGAHPFIMRLPQGYDTVVGERGIKLSGGQRQRVSIARALIRQPRVLVFDEATSSLDSASERVVQQAIETLSGRYTVVVVAHRLSTVMRAHQIVVFDSGRVAEIGTHDELVARGGRYHDLWQLQSEARELSADLPAPALQPGASRV